MKKRADRFNIYLIVLFLAFNSGCETNPFAKKEASTLRFHIEINPDGTDRNAPVPIYRANPHYVNVRLDPFIKEQHVKHAAVIDALGGFEIRIELDPTGSLLLDQYSTAAKGKRIAIFSQFGQARWLASPLIDKRISDGIFTFTPDASREEAERIVLGLNNVAKVAAKRGP